MTSKPVTTMARPSTGKISFWQSMQFFTVTRGKNGKLTERAVGRKKPEDATFIKGGRKAAMLEAERLWPGVLVEAPKPKRTAEDDVLGGEVEPGTVQELEPDEEARPIMAKPVKLSKQRGAVTGSPYLRITPKTPRLQ